MRALLFAGGLVLGGFFVWLLINQGWLSSGGYSSRYGSSYYDDSAYGSSYGRSYDRYGGSGGYGRAYPSYGGYNSCDAVVRRYYVRVRRRPRRGCDY